MHNVDIYVYILIYIYTYIRIYINIYIYIRIYKYINNSSMSTTSELPILPAYKKHQHRVKSITCYTV